MALQLVVEGRVVVQGEAFCTSDAEAARALSLRAVRALQQTAGLVAFVPSRNVVAAYLDAGVLRPEQARAAEEIALHWHSVTRSLHARCGLYRERTAPGVAGDNPSEAARTARYSAWAAWAGVQAVLPTVTLVDVTLDVAVDGLTWRGVRAKRGIAQQRAKRLVQASLWQYALAAGWVEARIGQAA